MSQIPNGQPKVVTLDDGTKVVVVMVQQNLPNGQKRVQPSAFTAAQLEEIKAQAAAQNTATATQVDTLLALIG